MRVAKKEELEKRNRGNREYKEYKIMRSVLFDGPFKEALYVNTAVWNRTVYPLFHSAYV